MVTMVSSYVKRIDNNAKKNILTTVTLQKNSGTIAEQLNNCHVIKRGDSTTENNWTTVTNIASSTSNKRRIEQLL